MDREEQEAILQAVTRNFRAATGRQPDAGEVEQLVQAFLAGPGSAGADDAKAFAGDLSAGRAENYPVDRPLTAYEQGLFEGYRGPGWNDDEFRDLSPGEKKYALAPGELWDRQRARDINLLQAFSGHGPDPEAKPAYGYGFGGFGASGPASAPGPRATAMQWYQKGDGAAWRRGDPSWLSPRNLQWFGGNYPEDDLGHQVSQAIASVPQQAGYEDDLAALGAGVGSFMEPVTRADNAVGNFYRVMDLPVYAVPSYLQGEAGLAESVADERLRAVNAKRFARVSPVMPGNVQSPAERIRALQQAQSDMEAVRPLDAAKSHYLHTGRPMSIGRSMLTDAAYNALDLTALATVGWGGVAGGMAGAARGGGMGAMKGRLPQVAAGAARGAARGATGEAIQEGAENVPFVAPSLLEAFNRLSQPTYGDNSPGVRAPVMDQQGNLTVTTPEQRQAALDEASRQRSEARARLQAVPPVDQRKYVTDFRAGGR